MKKYVVAYISFHENDLKLKIVEATTWQDALEGGFIGSMESLGDTITTIESAKEEAFNQDWLFDVIEI